ncbi:MAG: hypothetical protein V4507_09680 [Verrucomicrobiota bacterium]
MKILLGLLFLSIAPLSYGDDSSFSMSPIPNAEVYRDTALNEIKKELPAINPADLEMQSIEVRYPFDMSQYIKTPSQISIMFMKKSGRNESTDSAGNKTVIQDLIQVIISQNKETSALSFVVKETQSQTRYPKNFTTTSIQTTKSKK